ncbi:MAG: preprotein translocase subunit SecA [Clostridiaceae bacterium]|jgi:preprotein translocase subunit SecA|nr:preprotein translocase subunit SecA [Clostridiaceae bacterium]
MGLFDAIFGTYSERELKKNRQKVRSVLALAQDFKKKSEGELRGMTDLFQKRLADGETLDAILPEAFATVREASTRVLGMTHFPVQVEGGIVLHQGRIAEMRTGEGKTLVATLPVYLNALTGKGVHVVTVNDYLAKRDSEWMGKIYRYLGLDVGLIVHGLDKRTRRASYAADVTYGTNNEFGFDYLRDNMVLALEDCVQRSLHFAIVDEVDSILIDEARTPLIISGAGTDSSALYLKTNDFVRGLREKRVIQDEAIRTQDELEELESGADYIVDEKARSAVLTERGVAKAERFFKLENLSDQENYDINHHINQALKARGIMHLDRDYVIKDGEIVIVDDFTGRLMFGRRYSDGLHQAIEAKEGVDIRQENKTLATITFQNYFRMYKKLSGMTGTALTEEDEFREIYNLDVISIPTNEPMIREDAPDAIFKTERGKYNAVLDFVRERHEMGQPVLVGTVTVEHSEIISKLFMKAGIPHNVLNARYHEREAEIVAQAGRYGAVTIATNMAGRGTDIMLGGNPEFLARQEMRKQGYDDELIENSTAFNVTDDEAVLRARDVFTKLEKQFAAEIASEKARVIETGGLCIVGTERHESRRIDNQLRGRAGRQGDPGFSKFYLSLEDDLMRLFGGERMERMFSTLGVDETIEISHPLLAKSIESAQRRVEGMNFAIRKNVLEYDNVMNLQRQIIYKQRREVLEGHDLHAYFQRITEERMHSILADFMSRSSDPADWDREVLRSRVEDEFGSLPVLNALLHSREQEDGEAAVARLTEDALSKLESRATELGSDELLRQVERVVLLQTVDRHWMDHIDMMDDLRDSIGMRSYAQHDPVVEYKREGFDMFDAMNEAIKQDAVRLIMRARFVAESSTHMRRSVPDKLLEGRGSQGWSSASAPTRNIDDRGPMTTSAPEPKAAPVRKKYRPGRNDPCWCGSGKKYKNCHLSKDEEEER